MRNLVLRWYRRGRLALYILTVIAAVVVTIPILLILWLVRHIGRIPDILGQRVPVYEFVRRVIFSIGDIDSMLRFREDIRYMVLARAEFEDSDRWSLERNLRKSREEAKSEIERGELAFSLIGGATSLVLGSALGLQFLALGISLTALILTAFVSTRIVVVDTLAYRGVWCRQDSFRELQFKYSWNKAVMESTSTVLIAILSIILSRSDRGYVVGLDLIDAYYEYQESDLPPADFLKYYFNL